jgi:caffeoyl-CoA O-methyltransferase
MVIDPRVESYITSLCPQPDPELAAMEALAERKRFPSISRQTGALLGLLVRWIGARRVLELGSGFGHSALWLARALPEGGRIICTDHSSGNRDLALGYFRTAGLENRMEFIVGEALEIARAQKPGFDLIFSDIDREDYPRSIDVAVPLMHKGGLFISDSTLLAGKVADPAVTDPGTEAVRAFNRRVFAHPDLEAFLLPVGDGVTICRKK